MKNVKDITNFTTLMFLSFLSVTLFFSFQELSVTLFYLLLSYYIDYLILLLIALLPNFLFKSPLKSQYIYYIFIFYNAQKYIIYHRTPWCNGHSISISVCEVWGARAEVQVSRRKLHTHIHLDQARVKILSCIINK